MSIKGVTRPIDKLGRIVIPMEIRKGLGLSPGDTLDIYVHGANILLSSNKEQTTPSAIPSPLIEEFIEAANTLTENDVLMFIDLIHRVTKK